MKLSDSSLIHLTTFFTVTNDIGADSGASYFLSFLYIVILVSENKNYNHDDNDDVTIFQSCLFLYLYCY